MLRIKETKELDDVNRMVKDGWVLRSACCEGKEIKFLLAHDDPESEHRNKE